MASQRLPNFHQPQDKSQFDNRVDEDTTSDNRTNRDIQTNKGKGWDYNCCRNNYNYSPPWVVVGSDLIQHPMGSELLHLLNNCLQIPGQTSSSLLASVDH